MSLMVSLALALCPAQGPRDNCVIDGDTLWLAGEKIRLADIDAPELNGRCEGERVLAREARAALQRELGEGAVTMRRQGLDRYGRTLATVQVGGRSAGAALVAAGLARPWGGRPRGWCG